jgi:hypothetical protein
MVLKRLLDAVARILLLGPRRSFPIEEKTLAANGAMNIGRAVR